MHKNTIHKIQSLINFPGQMIQTSVSNKSTVRDQNTGEPVDKKRLKSSTHPSQWMDIIYIIIQTI